MAGRQLTPGLALLLMCVRWPPTKCKLEPMLEAKEVGVAFKHPIAVGRHNQVFPQPNAGWGDHRLVIPIVGGMGGGSFGPAGMGFVWQLDRCSSLAARYYVSLLSRVEAEYAR
eukprot:1188899-Prorocentrum_minimum.AAC.2